MKAQFKYAIRAGGSSRLIAFAIIFVMNLVFIVLGTIGVLPLAAQITAVSLAGTAIGVVAIFNIISDISMIHRLFAAPGAVFYALTPVPRKKTLAASVITMFVIDFITLSTSIVSVIILSINLGSRYTGLNTWDMLSTYGAPEIRYILLALALILAAYLYIVMIIVFCCALRKSIFYSKRLGGLLTFLSAVGIFYLTSLTPVLLAPFGVVTWFYGFITVTIGYLGMGMYAVIILLLTAAMFILSSRLMERKLNI